MLLVISELCTEASSSCCFFFSHRASMNSLVFPLVTMQAQREPPSDMQSKDKFLVQSVIAKQGATLKDVTADMVSVLLRCIFC